MVVFICFFVRIVKQIVLSVKKLRPQRKRVRRRGLHPIHRFCAQQYVTFVNFDFIFIGKINPPVNASREVLVSYVVINGSCPDCYFVLKTFVICFVCRLLNKIVDILPAHGYKIISLIHFRNHIRRVLVPVPILSFGCLCKSLHCKNRHKRHCHA